MLKFAAKQVWVYVIYPLLKQFVETTSNVYDDKALELLNEAILFVSNTLGVNAVAKLSNK